MVQTTVTMSVALSASLEVNEEPRTYKSPGLEMLLAKVRDGRGGVGWRGGRGGVEGWAGWRAGRGGRGGGMGGAEGVEGVGEDVQVSGAGDAAGQGEGRAGRGGLEGVCCWEGWGRTGEVE